MSTLPTLILAAGLGTRLDPITRLVAKPAVPLGGRTLAARVLDWLQTEGIRDVVLNLHARPETIAADIGDGARWGFRLRYSWEQAEVLGSAGGPRHALPLLNLDLARPDDAFLIVNGDTLCAIALAPMRAAHDARGAAVTLAVVPNPSPDHYNGIVADADGRITGFVPKGHAAGSWHFVGVQIARAGVFAPLLDGVPAETVAGIYRERVARGDRDLCIWPVDAPFLDVGTPRDYLSAALRWADASGSTIEPGAVVETGARVAACSVWAGATVVTGARLERCVVGGGVRVPAGFQAADALLLPASIARRTDRTEIRGDIAVFAL